jgi:two-component system cell cycle response regulator DivK
MPRILLVEDNELNRDMLTRRLERRGFEVVAAADGAEGVALARSAAPDLVLMDMSLPVLDGWEATRRLKADPATGRIPVIALTAHAMSGDREQAMAAGCDDFDTKPVELPRLLEKIGALLATPHVVPANARDTIETPAASRPDVVAFELPRAGLRDLAAVRDFVRAACEAAGGSAATTEALVLAADEVCANVLQHGYGAHGDEGGGPLEVRVSRDGDRLVVRITDRAALFDPGAATEPALAAPVHERPIGGLGWHLVRRTTDAVRWRPARPFGNEVTLVMAL